jgi:two-component system KDP operon response regulator KdpE
LSPWRVVSCTRLLDKVRERDFDTTTDNARTVVKQLRQKLEPDPHKPVYITTENGAGYRLCPSPSGAARGVPHRRRAS